MARKILNRKILNRVTVTGADNSIRAEDLLPLSQRFPYVECGILLSKSQMGNTRFPSREWLDTLASLALQLQLSGHICGRWVRDICEGNWTIYDDLPVLGTFKRLQLNFHSQVHRLDRDRFFGAITNLMAKGHLCDKQIIFQLDDVNNELLDFALSRGINAVGLFDRSGGNGILPESWPTSRYHYVGYAGGFSPDNLEEQLQLIEKQVGERLVWIDVETKVRSKDDRFFDLEKCRRFLEVAEPWVV